MFSFSGLWKALGEIPATPALRAHVDLLREQLKLAEQNMTTLQLENANLKERLREANAARPASGEYLESDGVLWKRNANGGFDRYPLCPECKVTMSAMEFFFPFQCHKCNYESNFKGQDLENVRPK